MHTLIFLQVPVLAAGLLVLLGQCSTQKESIPACILMEPGAVIPNQRKGKRTGIGWWWWLPTTDTPTTFVFTPAWTLSLGGWAPQVRNCCVVSDVPVVRLKWPMKGSNSFEFILKTMKTCFPLTCVTESKWEWQWLQNFTNVEVRWYRSLES